MIRSAPIYQRLLEGGWLARRGSSLDREREIGGGDNIVIYVWKNARRAKRNGDYVRLVKVERAAEGKDEKVA